MDQASLARLKLRAAANMFDLRQNKYPGRIIIVGLDETGENLVQVYAIMGRSANSRNRIFERDADRLFTTPADPSKVEDLSLIIYNAMREVDLDGDKCFIVSNGHQTDVVAQGYSDGVDLDHVMSCWVYEPDAPNFTSRITAISKWKGGIPLARMAILRKSPWSNACDRNFFEFSDFGKGFGHFISTYSYDGDPLPPFVGEPLLMPLIGSINDISKTYWGALDADNRVSLAVKFIPKEGPSETVIINEYEKVAAAA